MIKHLAYEQTHEKKILIETMLPILELKVYWRSGGTSPRIFFTSALDEVVGFTPQIPIG
jgi:hypothetical protein